jgi:gamma-glutamyltranspeptidase/glutathione hydrolase
MGEIAESLVSTIRDAGGCLTEEDFAAHRATWDEPLSSTFRDVKVCQMPPSTQGVTALQAMALFDGFVPPADIPLDPTRIHLAVECAKLSMADRNRWIGDPDFAPSAAPGLLDRARLDTQRATISITSAGPGHSPTIPPRADTVFIAVADGEGNLVALIQSLYSSFGSGVMDRRTGVLLHNRGSAFSLDPESPNCLEPRKRPLHTLIPGMAFRQGTPWLVFGTMGGDGQPQTQLQVLSHMLDHGMDVQTAIEQPRWLSGQFDGDEPLDALHLEDRYPSHIADALTALGHPIIRAGAWDRRMGHAQAIQVDLANGVYRGGADPRGDGLALGW